MKKSSIWILAILFAIDVIFAGAFDPEIERWIGLISVIGVIIATFTNKKNITPTFLSTMGYVAFWGITSIFAISGKFALYGINRLYIAVFIYIIVYFLANKSNSRTFVTIFAVASAIISFLSIDAASSGIISNIFKSVMQFFTTQYANNGSFEAGTRITSIVGNPNVFAGFVGLAVILSIYLVISSKNTKEKISAISLLSINALGFILAFSIGATASFAIAIIIYIILSKDKAKTTVIMLETALITLVIASIAFLGLGKTSGFLAFLPILLILLQIALLFIVDKYIGEKISIFLEKNLKTAQISLTVVIIAGIIFLISAINITTEYTGLDGTFTRSVYLDAGKHTVEVDKSETVAISIYSQNSEEIMMHQTTSLYSGYDNIIELDVPENSEVVKFDFSGTGDIKSANINGKNIKLKYLLLPEFIANRIQGIKSNQNAIQRLVFFKDGMKLFKEKPITGYGVGGFESAITGVQEFYYETKFIHNHYIQTLVEGGIIGFAIFIILIATMFWALFKSIRKKDLNPIIPSLASAMIMMSVHAFVEVIFSVGVYLIFAFFVFALISVNCDDEIDEKNTNNIAKTTVISLFSLLLILLIGNITSKFMTKTMSSDANKFFSTLDTAGAIDVYEKNDYLLSYVSNSRQIDSAKIHAQADKYALKLSKAHSNTIPQSLTSYYFNTNQEENAIKMMDRSIEISGSDSKTWQGQFDKLEEYISPVEKQDLTQVSKLEDIDTFVPLVIDRIAIFDKFNENRLQKVELSPKNNVFITKVLKIASIYNPTLSQILEIFTNTLLDTRLLTDSIKLTSGDAEITKNGIFTKTDSTFEISIVSSLEGLYIFDFRTNAPYNINSITINDQSGEILYDENGAYIPVSLPENPDGNLLSVKMAVAAGTQIDAIVIEKNKV